MEGSQGSPIPSSFLSIVIPNRFRMPSTGLGRQRCKLQNKKLESPAVKQVLHVRNVLENHSVDVRAMNTRGDIVGHVTLFYCAALHWPTLNTVSKATWRKVNLLWQWVRDNPMDGITCVHNRCEVCGWISRRQSIWDRRMRFDEVELCVLCGNVGVCESCMYVAHDGHRYCGGCDLSPGAPAKLEAVAAFLARYDLWERLDQLQALGDYTVERQVLREVFQSWASSPRRTSTAPSTFTCSDA